MTTPAWGFTLSWISHDDFPFFRHGNLKKHSFPMISASRSGQKMAWEVLRLEHPHDFISTQSDKRHGNLGKHKKTGSRADSKGHSPGI